MSRSTKAILAASTLAAWLVANPRLSAQLSFTPLGHLPGQGELVSFGLGVSPDGSAVVGESRDESSPGFRAGFRWTAATGMQPVTSTAPGGSGIAYGTSIGGSVVVGVSSGAPFRWTQIGGLVPLPVPAGGSGGGTARAVTPDGQTSAGFCLDGQFIDHSVRWTDGQAEFLGDLPGWSSSSALAVSAAGNVIVGRGLIAQSAPRPFRWQAETGTVALPLLPGYADGSASGVSMDGSVICGVCLGSQTARGVRWVNGIVQDIGVLPGETTSSVAAMNADGSVLVGYSGQRTFLWSEAGGMVDLAALIAPVMPPGWFGFNPIAMSHDGTALAGFASSTTPGMGGAVLVTVPAPGTVLIALFFKVWPKRRRCAN